MTEITNYEFNPLTREQSVVIGATSPYILYCGQGGCGKSHAGAAKAFIIASRYSKGCVAIVRKKRVDLTATLWKYFVDKILQPHYIIDKNESQLYYRICNGSEIYGLGLDSSGEVNKLASREYNFIVVEEATELSEEDFDTKIVRTLRLPTSPFHQVLLLCNPSSKRHWLYQRFFRRKDPNYVVVEGKTLPPPYLPEQYYNFLNSLTGIFARRYRDGEWVTAEGEVYPFDATKHIIPRFAIPDKWPRVVAMDFGFDIMHAMCIMWFAIAPDGKWYCYRQIYTTGRTVSSIAPLVKRYMIQDGILEQGIICDWDADGRATLQEHELTTLPARKERLAGQQAVHDVIATNSLFFFDDNLVERDVELVLHKLPTCAEDEFATYVWADKAKQDMINKHDHGMDVIRYAVKTRLHFDDGGYDTGRYAPNIISRQ